MATNTNYLGLTKPAQSDLYNIDVFNDNADAIDAAAEATAGNIATIEPVATASKTYVKGEFLVLNGVLYKTTAAIVNGAALVVGTNISKTTAGAELSQLNAELTYKSGDTIPIPQTRFISFGNSGGSSFLVHLYMTKRFLSSTTFTIHNSPYNYTGSIRVSNKNLTSSTIYITVIGGTNIVQLDINTSTSSGGNFEPAVWVPDKALYVTIP